MTMSQQQTNPDAAPGLTPPLSPAEARARQLDRDFVRAKRTKSAIRLAVRTIRATSPDRPTGRWKVVLKLAVDTPRAIVDQAMAALHYDVRYFGHCTRCAKRYPTGWMADATTCYDCARAAADQA